MNKTRKFRYKYLLLAIVVFAALLMQAGCTIVLADEAVVVQSVELPADRADGYLGKSVKLEPKIEPGFAADKRVEFTSSDESVVSVSEDGTLTGVGYGTAVITCTALDGSGAYDTMTFDIVPDKVKLSAAKKTAAGKLSVTWKKVKNASGYQVCVSTSSDFTENVKTYSVKGGDTLKLSKKGMLSGRKYYVKVRCCVNQDGAVYYGAWSDVKTAQLSTSTKAIVLMDQSTGEILYSKNGSEKLSIASITKLMTIVVALDSGVNLTDKFKVSAVADRASGSSAGIKAGEKVRVKDLIMGMLLPSGNDAAVCVAEGVAGSEKAFVKLMNAKAKELGLKNTKFYNSTGLTPRNADGSSTGKENTSTAEDVAKLTKYIYDNYPKVRAWAAKKTYTMPKTNLQEKREIYTTNCLKIPESAYYYEYCTGLKTGTTPEAGKCVVATAEKNGRSLIVCLLGDMTTEGANRWIEPVELFEQEFNE